MLRCVGSIPNTEQYRFLPSFQGVQFSADVTIVNPDEPCGFTHLQLRGSSGSVFTSQLPGLAQTSFGLVLHPDAEGSDTHILIV